MQIRPPLLVIAILGSLISACTPPATHPQTLEYRQQRDRAGGSNAPLYGPGAQEVINESTYRWEHDRFHEPWYPRRQSWHR